MDKIIEKINQDLENGLIPDELNFSEDKTINDLSYKMNWNMVKYNTFYKDRNYIIGKFPKGFDSLPGFDKIIDSIIDKIDPLEEMLERINISNNNIEDNGTGIDLYKFK